MIKVHTSLNEDHLEEIEKMFFTIYIHTIGVFYIKIRQTFMN